ncbi:hypothetical protein NE686_18125 [Tissierella carlieri]|uniref:Uncharacterized protein n=1 Tax=Tissierella carlieri TaxID=689904 RepID=A0ABT1SEX1_9FIRM|nr:hypothetical protein [Tissierella carlieri]MCQ4925024.1 hypothetical protein [Tissierella carlieri]
MEKIEIALELFENTRSKGIKDFIKNYILNIETIEESKCVDEKLIRFDNCLSYIEKVDFDISGWMLFDIPIFYAHCFLNNNTKKAFDLAVYDIGKVIVRYIDSDMNEEDCETIEQSIENYNMEMYEWAFEKVN